MARPNMKTALALLAVIAVAAMIFLFSAQEGDDSSELSGRVTGAVLSVLMPGFRQMSAAERQPYLERWGLVIRKLAHFSEYALLGMTLVNFLRLEVRGKRMRILLLLAWAAAAAYACTDELHQMYVSDRAAAVTDVCIDAAGAFTGALLASVWFKLRALKRK